MSWINAKIFEDTQRVYRENEVLAQAVGASTAAQQIISEEQMLPQANPRFTEKAGVSVSGKRTFEAAKRYADEGKKVCVLNFASSVNPGGGVIRGASAQEECLCRCSTLYPSLNSAEAWEKFYNPHRAKRNPLYDDDCIYTPNVVVFKSDTAKPELLAQEQWYMVNVVTCAAPNLQYDCDVSAEQLYDIHFKRVKRILNVAALHENDVLILGAFGCGAFMNNPEIVSAAMNEAIGAYAHMFETIEFAVYCPAYNDENYRVFSKNIAAD